MASNIDPTKPEDGVPAEKTALRANLQAAKDEIEALQTQTAAQLLVTAVTASASVSLVDPVVRVAGGGELNLASQELVLGDSASDVTLTIAQADVRDGWTCTVAKWGTGDVTIAAGTGLTLRTAVSATVFSQYGLLQATRLGNDLLVG